VQQVLQPWHYTSTHGHVFHPLRRIFSPKAVHLSGQHVSAMKKDEEIVISFLLHISDTTKQNATISNSTLHHSSALK
jgi:hypothetical protein